MEMKMVNFSGSDSFIGFIDLENVRIEPKIMSISRSSAEIPLFLGFQLSLPSLRGRMFDYNIAYIFASQCNKLVDLALNKKFDPGGLEG
jgi:hypothetical protein